MRVTKSEFRKNLKKYLELEEDVIEIESYGRVFKILVSPKFVQSNAQFVQSDAENSCQFVQSGDQLVQKEVLEEYKEFYNSETGEMVPMSKTQIKNKYGKNWINIWGR